MSRLAEKVARKLGLAVEPYGLMMDSIVPSFQAPSPDAASVAVKLKDVEFNVSPTERYAGFWKGYSTGRWEPDTFVVLDRFVRDGGLYIDIGAWVGPTVLYAAAKGARVVTFEPDPVAMTELNTNISLNFGFSSQITRVFAALASKNGVMKLYSQAAGNSESTLQTHITRRGALQDIKPIAVCRTIDADMAAKFFDFGDADLVKIDIEGGEYEIMPRLSEYFAARRPTIYLSFHPNNIGNNEEKPDDARRVKIEKSLSILDALDGYKAYRVVRGGLKPVAVSALRDEARNRPAIQEPVIFSVDSSL